MSLLTVRQKFIEFSGREDLASGTDYETDAGADFFINSGSRALDMEGDQDRSLKYYYNTLTADTCRLELTDCRTIIRVWLKDANDEWGELKAAGYEELLEDYPKLDGTDSGTPLVWAREPIHRDPANQGASPLMSTMGIIILPPMDVAYAIRIYGKFYEATLTANTDVNYWSEIHPMLLVWAALRELETTYRNTQGANDWDAAIKRKLFSIDKDLAEADERFEQEMEG